MEEQVVRTFIALESSIELSKLMGGTVEKLKKSGFNASWTKEDNTHLTLFFLGDTPMKKIAQIAYKMGERISGFPSFVFNVNQLGYFLGQDQNPRIIWLGLNHIQTLFGLYKEVLKSVAMIQNGKAEDFSPHITVGRVKSSPQNWKTVLDSTSFDPVAVPVDHICIYSSELTRNGSIYKKLYTIDFEGGVIING